jgi:flagellar FliL protein
MAEQKKGSEASDKPKMPMQKILTFAFVFFNLSVTSAGAFLVYSSTLGWESPLITEASIKIDPQFQYTSIENVPYVYTMEKFTVNLSGEPKRTIRLEVNLNMLGKQDFEEVMDFDNRARVRDRIVQLLNDKSFSELESIQGKLFLKDKIAMEVNTILNKGVVKDVFFTDFVVQ